MMLEPVRIYRDPRFPTWEDVKRDRSLLLNHVPRSWAAGGLARKALVASCLGLTAGSDLACSGGADDEQADQTGNAPPPMALMFEHGDGRGAFGCVVILPPVFLSEEEARQVIGEELSRVGLKLEQDRMSLEGMAQRREVAEGRRPDVTAGEPQPLLLDGFDPSLNVGVEYISSGDYEAVGGVDLLRDTTAGPCYDFKDAARFLAKRITDAPRAETIGVFYDPMVSPELPAYEDAESSVAAYDTALADARKAAAELLRLQVRDFAEWLREQGVLR